jgi:hypothetical protein
LSPSSLSCKTYKDDAGDLKVKVSIEQEQRPEEWNVPKTMAQPTSSILRSIVLVLLASRLWRGDLGFLQILEQRVDDVVDLLLGETIVVRLAERDRHIRRVVVVAVSSCEAM